MIKDENKQQVKTKKNKQKYRNKKVEFDGIKFDSKLEKNFYINQIKPNKNIESVEFHPSFMLQEGFEKNNKKYESIVYCADFKVTFKDGNVLIIDTKSPVTLTPQFRIKQKLFEKRYTDLTLSVVLYYNKKWLTYDGYLKEKRKLKKKKEAKNKK